MGTVSQMNIGKVAESSLCSQNLGFGVCRFTEELILSFSRPLLKILSGRKAHFILCRLAFHLISLVDWALKSLTTQSEKA